MMLKKKIALVQFNAVPEEKDINLGHMQRLVGEAVDAGARWIVFHEATLTDYTPKLTEFARTRADRALVMRGVIPHFKIGGGTRERRT